MDNEKELVRFILQYLLDNHFESKSDMARQLDIRHRTMQRVFEQLHNDKAKGSTIVLDRALLFCAKRNISVDQLFRETRTTCREQHWTPFTSKRTMEYSPLVTIFWCRLKKVVLMRFRSLTRFMFPISAFLPRLFARVVHTIAIPVAILTGYKAIALWHCQLVDCLIRQAKVKRKPSDNSPFARCFCTALC